MWVVSCATALVLGGAAGAAAMRQVLRHRLCPDVGAHELNDDDCAEITKHFRQHARAVREQVSSFADALAEGDQQLRERLRLFESGDQ